MAIRFKYDAASVAIPQNEARQRFGQQLVLQQQKYANDQRQLMRDQLYDQQRMGMQQAFILNRDAEQKRALGQQALAKLNQDQVFGANQDVAAQAAKMQKDRQLAAKAEMENIARLKAQERADDEDAIKTGGYDPVTASELKKSYALDTKIDLNPDYDEAQRAEAHRQNQENRRRLQESRIATPSMADRANKSLGHYVPSLQRFVNPEELQGLKQADPNIEVQVFQDGKMLPGPTPKQAPMSAQEYYRADSGMFKKDLASKMSELQGQVDAGELTLEDGQDVRSMAWQQMQDDYNFAQQALGTNQPVQGGSAIPPQGGEPAMSPSQSPVSQQPAMGMQDLEPIYNADGTTSAPGQPVMLPAVLGQQEKLQRDLDALQGLEAGQIADPLSIEQAGMQSPPQNAWSEVVAPEQQMPDQEMEKQPIVPVVAPDFKKLAGSITDASDRAVLGKLQGMYDKQTPDIQSAIGVVVAPEADKEMRAQAYLYLKSKGIDMSQLAKANKRQLPGMSGIR